MPSSGFKINTRGLAEFSRDLRKLDLSAAIAETLDQQTDIYLEKVRAATPEETGELAESWEKHIEVKAGNVSATVSSDVPYAAFIEFGTARIAGGKVLAWQPGDPPVKRWPGKAVGSNAQMPILRPIAAKMHNAVIRAVQAAVLKAAKAAIKRKY